VNSKNSFIGPWVAMLAVGVVLAIADVTPGTRYATDRTGLVDAYLSDPVANTLDTRERSSLAEETAMELSRAIQLAAVPLQFTNVHLATHVASMVITSLCLLAAACALLLLTKKSHSPSIISLLKLIGTLLGVNGAACLVHALTLWWPANTLDIALRVCAAATSIAIVIALILKLPRVISSHGRTNLKTAENELRLSKARFERALDGSSNGLWEWNIEANEVWYAPRFRELLGYKEVEFPNVLSSWKNALHPEDKQATLSALENHLSQHEAFDVEYRLQTKSGEYRWFHARGVAIRDPDKRPYLMAGSIQDIHERKQVEESLKEREDQLRHAQKLEAVGTLAGGIAHEFNNLIQAIQGYTVYAMDGLEATDPRHQDLDQVLIASKRAASLTKQLLGFSRRQILEFEILDLNQLVQDLTKLIRPLIGENITIQLNLDPSAGNIRADSSHIQQMLMNLCINARDAMPRGGTLTIRTSSVKSNEEKCRSLSLTHGKYSAISVNDTGCGIPADVRAHIFEPFFTTKEIGRGTGLGLAMAYGIVQQHAGSIQIDTEVGIGTTVTVFMQNRDETEIVEQRKLQNAERGGTETILIAEDDFIVRNLSERVLSRAGYHTLSAVDGQEAMNVFKDNADAISLVVLDVMMPNMNGHDVLKNIRALKLGVHAVMCTGYDPESIEIDSDPQDDVTYLQKPFEPNELLKTVREALETELCAVT
jgi:PAS domain S-box-containing protein